MSYSPMKNCSQEDFTVLKNGFADIRHHTTEVILFNYFVPNEMCNREMYYFMYIYACKS
jgi:hypothetical protein